MGRRILLSIARRAEMESPAIGGAIREMGQLTASNFVPDYRGGSERFKTAVENKLYEHDQHLDVEGFGWTMLEYRLGLMRVPWVEGDQGTILVEIEDQPYIQVIPSHRIGSDKDLVESGRFKGMRISDGVIVNNYNRPEAYRVLTGASGDFTQFEDVPVQSMFLSFLRLFRGQLRGYPLLGINAWPFQDIARSESAELHAQIVGASRMFQRWVVGGEAPVGSDFLSGPEAGDTTNGTPAGLWKEVIDEGGNEWHLEGSGERTEAIKFDRPTANQQAFVERQERKAFAGNGLSVDFALDPTKLGGANARVLIDKINVLRDLILRRLVEPAVRRIDGFRIPHWMEHGELPFVNDWHNLEYQGPPRLTADKKYDADVAATEIRNGTNTRTKRTAELGEALKDVRKTKGEEVRGKYLLAREIVKDFPEVTFQQALADIENDSLNGQVQADPSAQKEPGKPKEDAE